MDPEHLELVKQGLSEAGCFEEAWPILATVADGYDEENVFTASGEVNENIRFSRYFCSICTFSLVNLNTLCLQI